MCGFGTILKEGVTATLNGGFFLDPGQGRFICVTHTFLWLFLFTTPMAIKTLVPSSLVAWCSYATVITVVVCFIQYITNLLHKEFDKYEPVLQIASDYKELSSSDRLRETGVHDSELSLDTPCRHSLANVPASVEDVEEQCRRIGMAGLYIADLFNAQQVSNRNTEHVEHCNNARHGASSAPPHEISLLARPTSAFPSLIEPTGQPHATRTLIADSCNERKLTNSHEISHNLQRQHSDITQPAPSTSCAFVYPRHAFLNHHRESCPPPFPSLATDRSRDELRLTFRNLINQHSTDVNRLPSLNVSRHGSTNSRHWRRNHSTNLHTVGHRIVRLYQTPQLGRLRIVSRLARSLQPRGQAMAQLAFLEANQYRQPPLRSRTLPRRQAFDASQLSTFQSGGNLSTAVYDNLDFSSVAADQKSFLDPANDEDDHPVAVTEHSDLLRDSSVKPDYQRTDDPFIVEAITSEADTCLANPSSLTSLDGECLNHRMALPQPSTSVAAPSSSGIYEEILPLHPTSAAQFVTVRLRNRTSSPNERRLQAFQRRAVYASASGSPRQHLKPNPPALPTRPRDVPLITKNNSNSRRNEAPLYGPGATSASTSSRRAATSTMPPPPSTPVDERQLRRAALAARRNRHVLRQPLISLLRLPAFPPDVNSLDHAYSSPIRNNLLPRQEDRIIRNGASELQTTAAVRSTDRRQQHRGHHHHRIGTNNNAESPIDRDLERSPSPSGRALSLELQAVRSDSDVKRPRQLSSSSNSIYRLGQELASRTTASRIIDTAALWRQRSGTDSETAVEPDPSCRAPSLELPLLRFGSKTRELRKSSSSTSIDRLLREPRREQPRYRSTDPTVFEYLVVAVNGEHRMETDECPLRHTVSCSSETAATDYGVEECPCAEATTTEGRVPSRLSGNGADSGGGGDRSPRGPFLRFLQRRGRGGLRGSGVGSFRGRNGVAYLVRLFPFWKRRFLIKFDRLQLGALFDHKATAAELVSTILLTTLTTILGSLLLSSGAFNGFNLACFCWVLAGCQYSLVKSVQPDPASPRHGFNRLIVYSRSSLFCLLSTLLAVTMLLSGISDDPAVERDACPRSFFLTGIDANSWSKKAATSIRNISEMSNFMLYGVSLEPLWMVCVLKDLCGVLLLAFPLVFLFGLVPQVNTLASYVLEQLDTHVFGANGSVNLTSVLVSVVRSLVAAGVGFGFCYSAVTHADPQDTLFSAFWGLYVAMCFLMSRTPSNTGILRLLWDHISAPQPPTSPSRPLATPPSLVSAAQTAPGTSLSSGTRRFPPLLHRISASARNLFTAKMSTDISYDDDYPDGCGTGVGVDQRDRKARTWKSESAVVVNDIDCDDDDEMDAASGLDAVAGESSNVAGSQVDSLRMLTPWLSTSEGRQSRHRQSQSTIPPGGSVGTHWDRNYSPVVLAQPLKPPTPGLPFDNVFTDDDSTRVGRDSTASLESSSSDVVHHHQNRNRHSSYRRRHHSHPLHHPPSLPSSSSTFQPRRHASGAKTNSLNPVPEGASPPSSLSSSSSLSYSSTSPRRTHPLRPSPIPSNTTSPPPPLSANTISSDRSDPLPGRIVASMIVRVRNDLIVVFVLAVLSFAVHVSTVFTVPTLQPFLPRILTWVAILWGFMVHYVLPQLKKPYPWLIFSRALCAPNIDGRLAIFEVVYHWCHWFEKYFLIPAVTMASATQALLPVSAKFGHVLATFILLLTSMKMLRNGFTGANRMYLNLFFAEVLFLCDFPGLSETLPLDYFFVSILLSKIAELWNKLCFIYVYIAPFQASWGSICHAITQLGTIPHFISILGNCIFSTILSTPLEPFVASVFFIPSYVRPVRFWEATQKIHRIESTTTSLFSQLRGVSFEQVTANLNAIFYEHLARCLQQRLAGDIALGRWSGGSLAAGDVFILASEELHFLIHIIEIGNGLVTFQMRGLEFVGTYCHEQESNGLTEALQEDHGFCCFNFHRKPAAVLSLNAALRLRWLAWQFAQTPYTIEGYHLIDHSAATSLQVIDFRKMVLDLFIKCLLYFTTRLTNLSARLQLLAPELTERFVGENRADLDPIFSKLFDEDFDKTVSGVTRTAFVLVYADWIRYCLRRSKLEHQNRNVGPTDEFNLMTLCYAISILGRRCLGGVSGHLNSALETFLHYLHDVFKGDVQVAAKDDWVFADIELLKLVVTPAMRVALKLYQDHFAWNPFSTNRELYAAIQNTTRGVVICHETDPQWRSAVLNDAERLFSFRRVDSGTTQQCYRFIMMNRQTLSFQVIKLNSECVRGFWAGQQREQIFLRNKNPERGSIQHAKHVLRNLINSSCDQPVGYPIYVSPLITSFVESHPQYRRVACPSLSIPGFLRALCRLQDRVKQYCRQSYRSGLAAGSTDVEFQRIKPPMFPSTSRRDVLHQHQQQERLHLRRHERPDFHQDRRHHQNPRRSHPTGDLGGGGGGGTLSASSSLLHPTDSSDLAPWCFEGHPPPPPVSPTSTVVVHQTATATTTTATNGARRVKIIDPTQILGECLLKKLEWPSPNLMAKCLPQSACPQPLSSLVGLEGSLVRRWTPSNIDPRSRSFCHRSIALVAFPDGPHSLEGHLVTIWEDVGLEFLSAPPHPSSTSS